MRPDAVQNARCQQRAAPSEPTAAEPRHAGGFSLSASQVGEPSVEDTREFACTHSTHKQHTFNTCAPTHAAAFRGGSTFAQRAVAAAGAQLKERVTKRRDQVRLSHDLSRPRFLRNGRETPDGVDELEAEHSLTRRGDVPTSRLGSLNSSSQDTLEQ